MSALTDLRNIFPVNISAVIICGPIFLWNEPAMPIIRDLIICDLIILLSQFSLFGELAECIRLPSH